MYHQNAGAITMTATPTTTSSPILVAIKGETTMVMAISHLRELTPITTSMERIETMRKPKGPFSIFHIILITQLALKPHDYIDGKKPKLLHISTFSPP